MSNAIEKLLKLKESYKEIRKNTYCRKTEMNDCDSCMADHYLEVRLNTIDECIRLLKECEI